MIDGERRGPYELGELSEAGVRPDTYVWCKGMADWEKAEDVADICRYYRQRIFDLMHPSAKGPGSDSGSGASQAMAQPEADPYAAVPERFRGIVRRSGEIPGPQAGDSPDTSAPPAPTLFLSIFLTLFCFPITGMVAIYYSYRARAAWHESMRSDSSQNKQLYSEKEREELRRKSHDYDRQARMWIGITFFLSLIFYALLGHKFF